LNWRDSTVLITGGTGSLGKKLTRRLLAHHPPKKLIIFSRDELKQHEMQVSGFDDPRLRYFIGDVRDVTRLRRAFVDVDVVIHAAALKQVPACEYNPIEAVLTNVDGARNVIDAALDRGVKKVMAVSTDKAVNPVNLYGATKMVAEKLFVQANSYSGTGPTHFSCVRYGNVVASRGSVIPLFLEQRKTGKLTITDSRMTRFWMTLDQAARFVIGCTEEMRGGEVFVPKIPSMTIVDLAQAIGPDCEVEIVGIRPGEKLHEVLISEDEARHTVEQNGKFVIQPNHPWWSEQNGNDDRASMDGFRYTSDKNPLTMSVAELKQLVANLLNSE
jgi:UDP-N-acetylglucosamine 4,6-dehydratase